MRKLVLSAIAIIGLAMAAPVLAAEDDAKHPAAIGDVTPDCNRKPVTCSVLKTCDQACGFLQQCGLGKLDRDNDGIPCESICTKACDARS